MPWTLFKKKKTDELKNVMYNLVEVLRKVAILILPCMEETAQKMFNQLGITNKEFMNWESTKQNIEYAENAKVVEKGEPLFIRLDLTEEVEYLKEAMQK